MNRWGQPEGEARLDRNNHQGWYGGCFLQVLAAAAGFTVAKPYPDISGIDLQIDGTRGMTNGIPLARAQVKSWSDPQGNEHSLRYHGLNEKRFNALAERRTPVPVFLSLVVVPPDIHAFAGC